MFWKIAGFASICLATFLLSCENPASGGSNTVTADDFEPDNTRLGANPIEPDEAPQERTLKKEDVDWVTLSGVSGKTYKVFTTGNTDTYIRVYTLNSSSDSILITQGDDTKGNYNASVEFDCSSAKTYFIRISGSDETVSGSYKLSVVSSVGDDLFEADSTPNTAKSLSSSTQNRTITEDDVDWVYFSATTNDTIQLSASGDCRLMMSLYNRDSVSLLQSSPKSDSVAQVRYRIPSTGYYFVKITAQSPTVSGSYQLTYQRNSEGSIISPDSYENDNTRNTAKLLPSSSIIQQRTITLGDTDWVKLPVLNGTQYSVTFANSYIAGVMSAKSGVVLQGPSNSLSLNSSQNDTVYIKIYSTSTSAQNYTLTLSTFLQSTVEDPFENDNTQSRAKNKCMEIDTFIQDRTLTYSVSTPDTDWVAFPVYAGKQYTFRITKASTSSYIYYYLYNKTSSSYISSGSVSSSSTSSYMTYTPSVSDTMYLMIRLSGSGAVAYSLSVSGRFSNDSYEPDSTRSLAGSIGSSIQSRILLPNDTDWVTYTAVAGDSFIVQTTGQTDTRLALFTSSGTAPIVSGDDISTTDKNGRVSWKATLGGTYYICITGKNSSTSGSYSLGLMSINLGTIVEADTFEDDNTRAKALFITDTVMDVQNRSLTLSDTDWVAFPVKTGGKYTFNSTTSSSTSSYLYLYLYSSKNILLTSQSGYSISMSYTATANDTVYLRMTSSSVVSKYTLSMSYVAPPPPDVFEDDNTRDKALLLSDTILTSQQHSLTPADTDWVAFPVQAGARYTFSISNSNSSYYINMYLYSRSNSLLTSQTGYYSPTLSYTPTANDTVYLRITASSTSAMITKYYLSMTRLPPSPPDAYEDDNSKAKAQLVKDSVLNSQPHSLTVNDTDWIAVPVVAAGTYTVSVSNATGSYMNMYCYNSKNTLITSKISYTSPSYSYTASAADTLYYMFQSSSVISSYSITVTKVLPPSPDAYENDNSMELARRIATPLTSENHSLPSNDTDWVAFAAVKGGLYTVTATNTNSSAYMNMYLYSSSGEILYSRTYYSSPTMTYTPLVDDTLYCRITPYSSSTSVSRYTLSISQVVPDEYENDNTRLLAKDIVLDSVQSRTLTYADSDWVKIEVDSGYVYTVSAPATYTHYLYVYSGESSSYTTYNSGSSPICTITPQDSDTLYALVKYYSTSTSYQGPYTLKVTRK